MNKTVIQAFLLLGGDVVLSCRKSRSQALIANCYDPIPDDVKEKVYTRVF